jgi:hypothetical protein
MLPSGDPCEGRDPGTERASVLQGMKVHGCPPTRASSDREYLGYKTSDYVPSDAGGRRQANALNAPQDNHSHPPG